MKVRGEKGVLNGTPFLLLFLLENKYSASASEGAGGFASGAKIVKSGG
ncbi:MAG: hypothetical protein WCA20_38120 [Candidatus Sulfotelmatobacter sp.]